MSERLPRWEPQALAPHMGSVNPSSSGSIQLRRGLLFLGLLPVWCQVRSLSFDLSRDSSETFFSPIILDLQGPSGKPTIVLVHGIVQGGYFFNYSQPELGAPSGVKGLFEDAGYQVFNPSLPYHSGPSDAYTLSDGPVTADDYANSLASVRVCPVLCSAALGYIA